MSDVLDELREVLRERADTVMRYRDLQPMDMFYPLDAFAATHHLVDVDHWQETAPMCQRWCPAWQPEPEGHPTCWALDDAVDAPTGRPCIWPGRVTG